jgi:hypothetical protein
MTNKNYTKDSLEIINACEKVLLGISKCRAFTPLSPSGYVKCAPNDSDLDEVDRVLFLIAEYKELRKI